MLKVSICRSILIVLLTVVCFSCGCAGRKPETVYFPFEDLDYDIKNLTLVTQTPTATPSLTPTPELKFDFQIISPDGDNDEDTVITAKSAFLFDLTDSRVVFSKNLHEKIYPASTTKLLTALLTLKYCDFTDMVTVTKDNGGIEISGAQICGFKEGDNVSVETLLNCLMIYSGNDVANILAEHISGSLSAYKKQSDFELELLGANNTNFLNPSGLHEEKHYTTAYDLYLIFNECIKYDEFNYMLQQRKYSAKYTTAEGQALKTVFKATNLYHTGEVKVPEGFKIIGGKTGETYSAGNCLILLSYNPEGHVIMSGLFGVTDKAEIYEQMSYLLTLSK